VSKRPSTTDPSVTEDGDAFLTRWARRKRVVRGGGDPDAAAADTAGREPVRDRSEPSTADAPRGVDDDQPAEPADEDMPPLESIDEDTDMSGFFSPQVSQAVKKAALRKFFHSPVFNIVDGLDDYDDDFRNFEALGDIITSDMRGQMEREAEKAKEALAKDADAPPTPDAGDGEARPAEAAGEAGESGEARPDEAVEGDSVEEDRGDEEAARNGIAAGVTREPRGQARTGHGKLRPRGEDT
jgi:hypothetical protein